MENTRISLKEFAHDLKNILAVIKLYAQLGKQDTGATEPLLEKFTIISDQAAEAVRLINKLQSQLKEETGADSQQRLDVLLSNLPGMAYRCRNAPGWPMEFISEGCLQLTGYKPEEFINTDFQYEDIIHPDDRQYVIDTIGKFVSKNLPFTLEYRITTRGGIEKRVWEKGRQVNGNQEAENRLEGFIMDISEKIHAEEAMVSNQEKLMSIFRVSPSGIGLVKNRILIEVNDRICEMTGYTADELIGKSSQLLYPTQEEFEYVGHEKYRQIREKGIGMLETRWQHKNGSHIDVLLASTPMIQGDNSKGVIFTAMDITGWKKTEAEKRRMEEQLIQAQKLETIGILAGGVAHEFNNTLQVINTLTELSMMKLEPEHPISGYLQQIRTSIRQSSGFVGQLLTFARKQSVRPEKMNLNNFIGSILPMLQRLVGPKIDLQWQPSQLLRDVKLDPVQLNQVLINITLNAKDSITDHGKIIFITKNEHLKASSLAKYPDIKPGNYVMLSLEDTGCGMDDETMSKIFEPFFTTKPYGKGTGLGLATVYGIVSQNNGFIKVKSKPGRGTTFRIYFPALKN